MLSSYRVVDLTDHRGLIAGFILASLGAEVIAVEPPGGNPTRWRDDGLTWWAYSRGKASVVCSTREELVELVRGADVLIETEPAFSDAELAAINPARCMTTRPSATAQRTGGAGHQRGAGRAPGGDSDRPRWPPSPRRADAGARRPTAPPRFVERPQRSGPAGRRSAQQAMMRPAFRR
jgi:hypothetical protein